MEKEEKEAKTVSIVLSSEDQEYVERISREFGLIKMTDCLRLALRLASKQIDSQQSTTA